MDEHKRPAGKPYLITRSLTTENQESPIHFLRMNRIPREYFYRRNHFPYPTLIDDIYMLSVDGEVERSLNFHYRDFLNMPSKTIVAPIECSGNKRSYFRPKVYGEQWKDGAITQGEWRGVPLNTLISMTGIKKSAVEVLFEGRDCGKKPGYENKVCFQRSLPIPKALHPDTIIAYQYNGEPIPYKHGYPLRLIVPQWYGMASVKWLKRISVIPYSFEGPFQTDDYVYYPQKESDIGKRPVTTVNVNSTIQKPLDYQILDRGIHNIDGIAWTGEGRITKVEISLDEGRTWINVKLQVENEHPYSWVMWNYKWDAEKKGEYVIMSRAYDSAGRVQMFKPEWNRKGYGYNAVYAIRVKIE